MGLIQAYQIVDFNNPLSMRYYNHSKKSLERVKDIINVEPIQCFVPDTVPKDFKLKVNLKDNSSPSEVACYASHYHLVERMANGEKLIVLEQDVYLWPDREDIFRNLVATIDEYDCWFPGISNECYTMTQEVALLYLETSKKVKLGPLAVAHHACKRAMVLNPNRKFIWPVLGQKNLSGVSNDIVQTLKVSQSNIPAPITQHYILSTGSTILDRASKWTVTKDKNPDMYFSEDA
jgi:GR25 family glycosyltransferase involved in LPS biosynthesis